MYGVSYCHSHLQVQGLLQSRLSAVAAAGEDAKWQMVSVIVAAVPMYLEACGGTALSTANN